MPPKKKATTSSSSKPSSASSSGSAFFPAAEDRTCDKKGKNASAPAPPPLFVPEPGQKLTKEQHAILRAQRAQAAAEEKRALFGSWTGKTPVSVLHEQCQKMDWDKAQINVGKKSKGYQGSVIISRDDKKTREKIRFTYCDETKFYPTDQEAKHPQSLKDSLSSFFPIVYTTNKWAATYALHRLCSHLSLHRLLPPTHQDYWASLEVIRKASTPEQQQFDYAPDPFTALELKAKLAVEREKAEKDARERLEKEQEKLSKPWEEFQAVRITKEVEHLIDDALRSLGSEVSRTNAPKSFESNSSQMTSALESLGFLPIHITESLTYCTDQESCIEWLCRYVPEDDLPPTFAPKQEIKMISSVSASNTDAMAKEKALKRMLRSGFGNRVCEEALRVSKASEPLALAFLSRKLAGSSPNTNKHMTEDESVVQEELEVLDSIFGPRFFSEKLEGGGDFIRITLDLHPDAALEVHLHPDSGYPDQIPGLLVDFPSSPAFHRLSVLKRLCEESITRLGQPMIFDLVSWLDENASELLQTPLPLKSLAVMDMFDRTEVGKGGEEGKGKSAAVLQQQKRRDRGGLHGEVVQARLVEVEKSDEFLEMLKFRKKLPSFAYREKIIEALNSSPVLILCGETGCGKSTQTGQFILENEVKLGKGGSCNIICTQPRRISALSLAERVAAERGERVGESIGYTVRGETKKSSFTRMTFCTTGVLLRMVQGDPTLESITHVIIDEVHERSVDSDFLLVILKDLLKRRKDLTLILMSATINSETFSAYFSSAPVLTIPGFTHPVKDVYLEDIFQTVKYIPDIKGRRAAKCAEEESAERERTYMGMGIEPRAIKYLLKEGIHEPVDYGFISALVRNICETNEDSGAILIFLQGALEIDRCLQALQTDCGDLKLELYPLHASLSPKQQSAVFRRPRKGYRKVVASTNVAETSITIDDVVFVIDSGRTFTLASLAFPKPEMRFESSVMALTETLASVASCRQRRGRAGRVRPGICYKLYSRYLEKTEMPPQTVPEILRVPLEQLCLGLKAMGVRDVVGFLVKAVDPPPLQNIKMAMDDLKSLSAIEDETEELTSLGQHLAAIPADVRVAKMLIFGAIFHCLSPILTISAMMSTKSPFVGGGTKREDARNARKVFGWDRSDWLTDCRAFEKWVEARGRGRGAEMEFCEKNFLSPVTLSTIADLRRQYLDILRDLGFLTQSDGKERWDENSGDSRLVKAAIVAGLYPRVVVVRHPDTRYVETAFGAMPKEAQAQQIQFLEPGESRVYIHTASINYDVTKFEDLLLVYHQKISTTKLFIRDSTMVSPWPILMLGGKLTVDHTNRTVEVDGFTKFQAFPRVAVLVNGLRKLLDRELGRKVDDPTLDISESVVGRCMMKILTQ
ncbi:hypothetical protein HDU67_002803 [Dinochytrium kinnereticum]|nr:hypothetical protein HDU67_002803 [Dinochytrium kinnereticum]